MKKPVKIILFSIVGVLALGVLNLGGGLLYNQIKYKSIDNEQNDPYEGNSAHLLWRLDHPTEEYIDDTISYKTNEIDDELISLNIKRDAKTINERLDKMDFACLRLYRIYKGLSDNLDMTKVSKAKLKEIKDVLLNMKFAITDKGEDSVYYYTENHQIAYYTLEYLIGKEFEDERFSNDNVLGKNKEIEGRNRILNWINNRALYGYSEFNSMNYYIFDIVSLSLLLTYGDLSDEVLMSNAKSALDLVLLDYAYVYSASCDSLQGPQGRAYARNNLNSLYDEKDSIYISNYLFKDDDKASYHYFLSGEKPGAFINAVEKGYYQIPDLIKELGSSEEELVIKTSQGVNLSYLEENNLIDSSFDSMMLTMGLGALTNKEVINATMEFVDENNLYTCKPIYQLKYLNINTLRAFNLYPFLSESLNLVSNGMAIERANIYTYKNKSYKLSSLQNYKVKEYGHQVTTMSLSVKVTKDDKVFGLPIYTLNPARHKTSKTATPGVWSGYGTAPDARQEKNICMMIHNIDKTPFLAVESLPKYTHTFFPTEYFDEYEVVDNYAFAKINDTYVAIIGSSDLTLASYNKDMAKSASGVLTSEKPFELIQNGKKQATIYEISDSSKESYNDFINRIKANTLKFNKSKLSLEYKSNNKSYILDYNKSFKIDGVEIDSNHDRVNIIDSSNKQIAKVEYLSKKINYRYKNKEINIDFK